MWSHYADSHKGICLGFNSIRVKNSICFEMEDIISYLDPPLNKYAHIFKVNYLKHLPKAYNGLKDSPEETIKFIKTKYIDW